MHIIVCFTCSCISCDARSMNGTFKYLQLIVIHLFACSICEWLYALLELEQSHLQRKFSNIVWSSYRIFTCTIVCCVVTQNLWLYLKCIQNTTRHKTSSQYKVCFFQSNMVLWQQITNVHLSEQKTQFWLHRDLKLKYWTTIVCFITMSVCLWYKFDVELEASEIVMTHANVHYI